VVARILAEKLRVNTGQSVVVENRAGGAGNIAAQSVTAAAADGYTALMTTSAITINPWMTPTGFDPVKDLQAITRVALSPYVLIVRSSLPVNSLDDFVALAKSQPGKLTCSTYGVGSPPHLALELLKQEAGIDVVHAPYRGFGQALPDLTTGLLDCAVDTPANCEQHVTAGTLKAIAVTSPSALAKFPGAVSMSSRYPKVMVEGWQGILLPSGVPADVRDRLNRELVKIIRDPDIDRRLRELGFDPVGDTAQQAAEVLKADYERFGPVIRSLKLKVE
jgi:tripartite-type tricarboxylate transporter receptor subunit TctC